MQSFPNIIDLQMNRDFDLFCRVATLNLPPFSVQKSGEVLKKVFTFNQCPKSLFWSTLKRGTKKKVITFNKCGNLRGNLIFWSSFYDCMGKSNLMLLYCEFQKELSKNLYSLFFENNREKFK